MFQISAQAKYTYLKKKKYTYAMYKSTCKYHSVLSNYISGFRKHKSNIDMANNYVLF